MIKYTIYLLGLAATCIAGPIVIWNDYIKGDYFLVALDVVVVLMILDWLLRKVKST